MSIAKRARTLKRQDTPSSENFVMEEWPVVFVKGASMPVPVGPPMLKFQKRCVRIYATCPWLQKIAFGHAAYQQHEAEYTRSVITRIRALAHAAHNKGPVVAEASQAPVIQDDDLAGLDDVSDDPDSQGSRANSQGSDPRTGRHGTAVWMAVDLDDVLLRVLLGRGVTIFVELNSDNIKALVDALRAERRSQGDAASPRQPLEYEPVDGGSCLLPMDEGRVSWSATKHSFVLSYHSAKAKHILTHSRPDILVPRTSPDGISLSRQTVLADCAKKVEKARIIWDVLDRSDSERYSDIADM